MNSSAFGPIVTTTMPHIRRQLTPTSRPLSPARTRAGLSMPRMMASGGASWLGSRDTVRQRNRGRSPDWSLAGFAEGGRPDMGNIAMRDAQMGMFNRAIPDYMLGRFAQGGLALAGGGEPARNAGSGLFADPDMLDKDFGYARSMAPEAYESSKMLDAISRYQDRIPALKRSMMDRGFGLPDGAMEAGGDSWRDIALDPQNAFALAVKPAMMGLSGAMYSGEAGAPEEPGRWNWSRRRAEAERFKSMLERLPALPDAHALRRKR